MEKIALYVKAIKHGKLHRSIQIFKHPTPEKINTHTGRGVYMY